VGCGGPRTGGWGHPPLRRVTIDFVGAAVLSGPSITAAPPWSPSSVMGLRPCHLLPCGAKALACIFGDAQMSMAFPSSVTAAPCHLPPGEGIVRANLAFPLPGGRFPLSRGKCPEGTKGIGKVAPKGPDEGDPRGCIRPRRAAEDSGPYGRGSSHPSLRERCDLPIFQYTPQYQNRIQRYGLKTNRFPGKPGHFHQKS